MIKREGGIDMRKVPIILGVVLGSLALVVIIMFSMGYVNVGYTRTVGVAQADAESKTYKQTQSYVEGKIKDLQSLKTEYEDRKGTAAGTAVLDTVRQRFADFPAEKVPDYMKSWYVEVMQGTLKK